MPRDPIEQIYGERAPEDLPVYGVGRAAALLHLPPSTLRAWACGWHGHGPLFELASREPTALSFKNLIEAYVLSAMRKVHNVPMQRVRRGLEFLGSTLHIERPLISASFHTDGVDLFIAQARALLNISMRGQLLLREVLEASLERIEWRDGFAAALYLPVRAGDFHSPKTIVIDPRCGFAKPVIAGTGIETSVVAGRFRAGESMVELARDYTVDVAKIEDAVRCETREAA